MKYDITEISNIIGAHRTGDKPYSISYLLTDSRSLTFPEETLFFAITTARNDGHRYIAELYAKGTRNFVVTSVPEDIKPDANYLLVDDAVTALQQLATHHRRQFSDIPVIGITGSNGKTMVKEWLSQLLTPSMDITRSPRSYNSQTGVPLSVWNLSSRTQAAIFEAGISQPGEMQRIAPVISPTIGIFTNIGQAHQENFTSLEEKCREKLQLFKTCDTIIYDEDSVALGSSSKFSSLLSSPSLHPSGRSGKGALSLISVSQTNPVAAFYVNSIDETPEGKITIHYTYTPPSQEQASISASYTLPFISKAAIHNSLLCAAAALHMGLTPGELDEHMQALQPVEMRLEVIQARNNCIIINDSYNSDIPSLDIALDFAWRRFNRHTTLQRSNTLILSDIEQTGLKPEEICSQVMPLIIKRGIKKLITIGSQITAETLQQAGISTTGMLFVNYHDTPQFLASSTFGTLRNENILIKGARSFHFDDITSMLISQVHETTMEINLSALIGNLNFYRSFLKPHTKTCCMIKAEAYGAGAIEVAKTLQENNVDYLAVAVADEGAELRKAGITADIIVMNPEMTAFRTIFDNNLQPEVYSFRLLRAMIQAAQREGITGWPIHIKLDTGMHRLGFHPIADMEQLTRELTQQNAVTPRSVFSHFVGSDEDRFNDFSQQQYDLFCKGADALQQAFPHHILRHICNTAGIEHFPERHHDMVRLGLGLYGINPYTSQIIHNVSTLRTTILQIHDIPAGDTVGYSRRTTLNRDSRIAAIPIGYADGLDRRLGNRNAYCLVNGQQAQYVGNICMDVAMIDVTDIDCHEGDSVEIFGDNLPVTILSDKLGTIPYEILTSISPRVRRIYYNN